MENHGTWEMVGNARWAPMEGDSQQQPLLDPNSAMIIAEVPKYNLAFLPGGSLGRQSSGAKFSLCE